MSTIWLGTVDPILESEIFKFNFLNFCITETRLYILLKLAQFTLNK